MKLAQGTSKLLARRGSHLTSLAAAVTLFAATYGGQSAQACDCIDEGIARNFDRSDHVFVGRVLFGLELPRHFLYLAAVERNFTGCESTRGLVWLQTEQNWGSCGTRFTPGQAYLMFANKVPGALGFALATDDCAGNKPLEQVTSVDFQYLDTRQNCCGDDCSCQLGVNRVSCEQDPCSLALPCDTAGPVRCEVNSCGSCQAEFYDRDGIRACLGDEGTEPLDPRCVDHKGYDFGECTASPGWLVLDGTCQAIQNGCGTLVGGNMPVFPSEAACKAVCQDAAKRYSCGDALTCDKTTSYCEEVFPGQEPQPGEPTAYYTCRPLAERCIGAPTCDACFEIDEGGQWFLSDDGFPASCYEMGPGELFVNIALP